jgi:WD40 repeat protein
MKTGGIRTHRRDAGRESTVKKYLTYISNGRYAAGTTGRTVHVFDGEGNKLAEFRDLTYAYEAAFTPSGDKLIVKSTEGKLALYSLTELKLVKKLSFGSAPQDGGFCFSHDGKRFLMVVLKGKPRIMAYGAEDLTEPGEVFSSDTLGVHDLEPGADGEYYVIGHSDEDFVGILKDGAIEETHAIPFGKLMIYADALRLRRMGYTEEAYRWSASAMGTIPGSLSLREFKEADLTLKKLFGETV